MSEDSKVADAVQAHWVHRWLPRAWWPYAQLARLERPIGWWLLMWPCWWSLMLAAGQGTLVASLPARLAAVLWLMALFMAGAVLMRGAGCTYNDLVDQDIDARVARTRSRPLPSGRVRRTGALVFLAAQLALGLLVLVQFNRLTVLLGLASLATVVIYPFMKRVTWWPQFFLGLAFSWGALMGWPALVGSFGWPPLLLYAGCIFWVIGYDTIYAHQDIDDDALVGVRSTARLFGEHTRAALAVLYGLALALFAAAWAAAGVSWLGWLGLGAGAAHLAWQVVSLDIADPARCLRLFRSNSQFGWIVFAGLAAAAFVPV
ncbi:MAG: 4-hydroxybenzoate octaprenyltransferase [Alphaproteobacteria bacterium]|nr:MAG: 4-hydroxybenzoate octaprenyltransferase [Alphaproteobacteria bacterium]